MTTVPEPDLALHELHRPRNLHRVLDRLSRRTLAHMSLQRPIDLFLIRALGQPNRVVHVDLREQNDSVHDLVRPLSRAADVTVRNCNPAHLQGQAGMLLEQAMYGRSPS